MISQKNALPRNRHKSTILQLTTDLQVPEFLDETAKGGGQHETNNHSLTTVRMADWQARLKSAVKAMYWSHRCDRRTMPRSPDYQSQRRRSEVFDERQIKSAPCFASANIVKDFGGKERKSHQFSIKDTSFGIISFRKESEPASHRHPTSYFSVNPLDHPRASFDALIKGPKLTKPRVVISFGGSAKNCFTKEKETHIFKEIAESAKALGAWILTDGFSVGVTKYVIKAVRESALNEPQGNRLVVIGICSWDNIENNQQLLDETGEGRFPADYTIRNRNNEKGRFSLDEDHDHLILVNDSGHCCNGGTVTSWRLRFEKYIAHKVRTPTDAEYRINTPVVHVIVNGGSRTIMNAADAVREGIPIIILEGTKRAADVLAKAYHLSSHITDWDETTTDVIKGKINWLLQQKLRSAGPRQLDAVMQIMRDTKLVTVFDVNAFGDHEDFENCVIKAVMKTKLSNPTAQLLISLAWQKPELAANGIPRTAFQSKPIPSQSFSKIFYGMLLRNEFKFVQLLIDWGFSINECISGRALGRLYKKTFQINCTQTVQLEELMDSLVPIPSELPRRYSSRPRQVGEFLQLLIGSHYPKYYQDIGQEAALDTAVSPCNDQSLNVSADPLRHLLLWAVLFNRHELANIFWKQGDNHIGAALLSCLVSSKLSQFAKEAHMNEISNLYQELKLWFELCANGVLQECHSYNKELTIAAVTRSIKAIGNSSPIVLAAEIGQKSFMVLPTCQLKLDKIWRGNIAMGTPVWKLILAAIMPLVCLLLLHFVRKRDDQTRADETKDDECAEELFTRANRRYRLTTAKTGRSEFPKAPSNRSTNETVLPESTMSLTERRDKPYYTVSFSGDDKNNISYLTALRYFFTAPVTKFIYNAISYLTFLSIFSIFVLTELEPFQEGFRNIKIFEILAWTWYASFVVEEVRQMYSNTKSKRVHKLKTWWKDYWNRMDALMYTVFLAAIILRFVLAKQTFAYARMTYVVALSLLIIRCSQLFYVFRQIGPKIIMIQKMLWDLFFFIFILSLFLLSFGVAYRSLLYPNSELNRGLFANLVYNPYFTIFGQIPLDEVFLGGDSGCNHTVSSEFGHESVCPNTNWLASLYLVLYCLIANVLLVNLLVALFSSTVSMVQEDSENIWKYHRYSIIYEFYDRPFMPFPLMLLSHVHHMFFALYKRAHHQEKLWFNDFKVELGPQMDARVRELEKEASHIYITKLQKASKIDSVTTEVQAISERTSAILDDTEYIKESIQSSINSIARNSFFKSGMKKVTKENSQGQQRPLDPDFHEGDSRQDPPLAAGSSDAPRSSDLVIHKDISCTKVDNISLVHDLEERFEAVHERFDNLTAQLSMQTNYLSDQLKLLRSEIHYLNVAGKSLPTNSSSSLTPVQNA